MKLLTFFACGVFAVSTPALVWNVNFTSNPGLLGSNENPPNGSPAAGGELSDFGGAGITYDDVGNVFNINIGYGTDVGYIADLTGTFSAAHIHQSTVLGGNGPAIITLTSLNNNPVSNQEGTITGLTDPLTADEEIALFAGLLYINIHSSTFPDGEIRGNLGNLTVVPEPSTYAVIAGLGLIGFAAYRRLKTAAV